MARSRPTDGLERLLAAATRVFGFKGFTKASMGDVAQEMGVSYGTVYTYVETKEALFHAVVERIVSGRPTRADLPIAPPLPGETFRLVAKALRDGLAVPALEIALATEPPLDAVPELEAIIRQHYAGVARYRDLLAIVERSAVDLPEVHKAFYRQGRRPFVRQLATYFEQRMSAERLRSVPDPMVTARFVIESVAWFANHRHGDPDSATINDAAAETTVIDMILAALRP